MNRPFRRCAFLATVLCALVPFGGAVVNWTGDFSGDLARETWIYEGGSKLDSYFYGVDANTVLSLQSPHDATFIYGAGSWHAKGTEGKAKFDHAFFVYETAAQPPNMVISKAKSRLSMVKSASSGFVGGNYHEVLKNNFGGPSFKSTTNGLYLGFLQP